MKSGVAGPWDCSDGVVSSLSYMAGNVADDRAVLPGTLGRALPLPHSPLLVLQGGGRSPLYPPNKAIVYNDALGVSVAELEFG